jgi:hypothetical protein
LNESIYSDNNDLVELNNKCLNESILNCDKTNFEFSNLNNKCLSFEHSPKSVLSLYILSLKQLLFRSLKTVLSLFTSDHIDIGDLNNKCLNENIFNNKTDFDYLNYTCLNESIYGDNNDLVESNNKCLNESILNCDKTDFEFSNLNNKCLSKSVNSDNTDFSDYHSKVPEILDIAIYF